MDPSTGTSSHACGRQPEFLDAVADLVAIQSEQRAGAVWLPPLRLQRLDDQAALQLFEIDAGRPAARTRRRR